MGREVKGDFEMLGLSTFWGLFNLIFFEVPYLHKQEVLTKVFQNIYATTFALCLCAIIVSYLASWAAKQQEWKFIKNFLKPKNIQFRRKK